MDRRRQSYASVVGGASSSATPSPIRAGQLANVMNPSPPAPTYTAAAAEQSEQRSQHSNATYPDDTTKQNYSPNPLGKKSNTQNSWNQGGSTAYMGQATLANMSLRPSYLRGTSYMARLDAAHRAKHISQREQFANGQHGAGQSSLSTSSSSASLPRMAPSHRGMTYEIVEHQPQVDEDAIPPLPSKWTEVDKFGGLEVSGDGLDVRYSGSHKSQDHEAAAARTDHPMPPQCGIYYYEVSLISKGKEGYDIYLYVGSSMY